MFKKLLASSIGILGALLTPGLSLAQEGVCVQVYGGGVVCGITHEPVPAGLGDNLGILVGILLFASLVLFYFSRKISSNKKVGK